MCGAVEQQRGNAVPERYVAQLRDTHDIHRSRWLQSSLGAIIRSNKNLLPRSIKGPLIVVDISDPVMKPSKFVEPL